MEFIRCDHTIFWIPELPPELVTDRGYIKRHVWFRSILDGKDDSSGGEKKHDHDQYRDYGPCQFDLRASVDLSRFGRRIRRACAKLERSKGEESTDHQKNSTSDRGDK